MTDSVDKLITRWRKLAGDKSRRHSHWDDLARVMLPRRMGFTTTVVEGERRTDDIYDGTPMQAARGLANAIGGMMRPSGIPQIQMRADDDALNNLGESQDWLADSTDRFLNAYSNPKARYLQVAPEIDQDLVVFGTAVEFVGESKNRNRLLFQSLHLKDVTPFFSEDGDVEGLFRPSIGGSVWRKIPVGRYPSVPARQPGQEDRLPARGITAQGVQGWFHAVQKPAHCRLVD